MCRGQDRRMWESGSNLSKAGCYVTSREKILGMLLLGSAGRNSGKTELACAIIERLSSECNIVGVKVTTIHERNGPCPRGGEGCGACSSLTGDYCITEEDGSTLGKDTTRMLASGAERVYWIRAYQEQLKDGVEELLDIIGHDAMTVAESNSLSSLFEPGLFLMIEETGAGMYKPSARETLRYVDRIVRSDGKTFDLELDRIVIDRGKWVLQR